jgi:antitoxin component of RelBE/YafQ-DinJ toxin-antitoxin module
MLLHLASESTGNLNLKHSLKERADAYYQKMGMTASNLLLSNSLVFIAKASEHDRK